MRSLHLVFAIACCVAGPALALDTTIAGVAKTTFVASQLTSAPFDNKLVAAARDDAASFVGSGGQIHSARLQAALHWLREQHPGLPASDLQLAEAILVQ